jgi:hypothetical protein
MTLAVPTVFPTVHLNGTSKRELFDGYLNAYRAVIDAIGAVQASAPNARDYYPQGNDAFRAARDEHVARLHALQTVADGLEAIAVAIDA